jgi:light-regulated signal transduction histidine kinase (bacteriophytochrome)
VKALRDAEREFERLYAVALEVYLRHNDEEALSVAYELGRRAMRQGLGVLDMATAHQAAVVSFVPGSRELQISRGAAAEDFFRELLSPFEMMFRGYAEANLELRRVNDALLREREAVLVANRELDSFSASVAHDLRAPLRAIAGFSSILEDAETGSLNEDQRDCVSRIRNGGATMSQLIESLLALSRVTRKDVERAHVDLTALGREILARLKHGDPDRDVEVQIHDALLVDADPGLLRVVVENLLSNAWKFTSKRPKAQIELGKLASGPTETVYFVRDDGAGFDMAYSAKLFDPFQRLHTTAEFDGTGIGLATVQRIIRRHHGRIWAESVPERGATFYFTLDEKRAA